MTRDTHSNAHTAAILSPGLREEDLMAVLWMVGTASHERAPPPVWRRAVDRGIAAV